MAQAADRDAQQRPDLASFLELDLSMQRRGYVATKLMSPFEVAVSSGKYRRVKLKSLLANANADTKRTSKGGYNEGDYEYEKASFITEEYGFKAPIDDREAAITDDPDLDEELARDRAWEIVLNNLEGRVLAKAIDEVVAASQTAAAAAVWTNYANATPIDDVEAACEAIWGRTGVWPNTLAMSRRRFKNLKRCQQVIDALQASGAGQSAVQGLVTTQQLAEVLDLDDIVISDAIKNTANIGQDVNIASMFPDDKVWVGLTSDSRDWKTPCFGRLLHWGGDGSRIGEERMIGVVERYRDEDIRSDVIRVRHETDEHKLYQEMAQVITGIAS